MKDDGVRKQLKVKNKFRLIEITWPEGPQTFSIVVYDKVEIFAENRIAAEKLFMDLALSGMYDVDYFFCLSTNINTD